MIHADLYFSSYPTLAIEIYERFKEIFPDQ